MTMTMTMTYCKGCHIHSHSHSHGHIHSHGHSHSHGHDHQHSHSHSHGRIPGGVFSLQNRRHIDTIVGHTLQSIIRRIVEKLHREMQTSAGFNNCWHEWVNRPTG